MSLRTLGIVSVLIALAALSAGVGAVAWTILQPPQLSQSLAGARVSGGASARPPPTSRRLAKEDFEAIVGRRLQQPLFDPPPPPPPPPVEKPQPQPPAVKLLATMIEPTGNQAMMADSKGTVRIVGVGDQVSGGASSAEVVDIAQNQVVLKCEEVLFTLRLSGGP